MKTAGVRLSRTSGQYVPTIDGIDTSPTSFTEERALEIAQEQIERQMKTTHTPTPWKLDNHGINEPEYGNGVVFSQGGAHLFCRIEGVGSLHTVDMDVAKLEANARHIVHAVNCHEELKAALEMMLVEAEMPADYVLALCHKYGVSSVEQLKPFAIKAARAALARAGGEGQL